MNPNNYLKLNFFILIVIALTVNFKAKACVDYHPVPPTITVKVDSNFNKIEITVHQLNIFAGNAGDFCTCGLSDYANIFPSIYYVAFVDSGTTNPVIGFDIWNTNASSTTAWSAVMPGTNWSGFVAEVITGMTPGAPVELIIRADLPAGFTSLLIIDSSLAFTNLGTDQWDNNSNILANTHQSVSGFGASQISLVPSVYFTGLNDLDMDFQIKVFPNPNSGEFSVVMPESVPESELGIYNMLGEKIHWQKMNSGYTGIDMGIQKKGLYLIQIVKEGKLLKTKKLFLAS